jgi:hypothetical protein
MCVEHEPFVSTFLYTLDLFVVGHRVAWHIRVLFFLAKQNIASEKYIFIFIVFTETYCTISNSSILKYIKYNKVKEVVQKTYREARDVSVPSPRRPCHLKKKTPGARLKPPSTLLPSHS